MIERYSSRSVVLLYGADPYRTLIWVHLSWLIIRDRHHWLMIAWSRYCTRCVYVIPGRPLYLALRWAEMFFDKIFFIALSVFKSFCFSPFPPSLTCLAVADTLFSFSPCPFPFSVTAISWNRSPRPVKDSGNCQEGLPWQGLDKNAAISDYQKAK